MCELCGGLREGGLSGGHREMFTHHVSAASEMLLMQRVEVCQEPEGRLGAADEELVIHQTPCDPADPHRDQILKILC